MAESGALNLDWRNILRGPHVQQARVVLPHVLDLEGLTVGLVQSVASPTGTRRHAYTSGAIPSRRARVVSVLLPRAAKRKTPVSANVPDREV